MNANRDISDRDMKMPRENLEDNGKKRFWYKIGIVLTTVSIIIFIMWEVL